VIQTNAHPLESEPEHQLDLARQLVSRLERLSADSVWARRASGYRAALLKSIQRLEQNRTQAIGSEDLTQETQHLSLLVEGGYQILDFAGRELIKGRRFTKRR
jgi:hypothetical protein